MDITAYLGFYDVDDLMELMFARSVCLFSL